MGTSLPTEPRWSDNAPPAEKTLWRWAVDQLPDDVLVLPQVAMTVAKDGRTQEAEADLVLVDPAHGVTLVEVKGGTLSYDPSRARWQRAPGNSRRPKLIRDPVNQAKRARSVLRTALKAGGIDPDTIALQWAVATPDCRLEAPGEPILDDSLLWDALAGERLAELYARTVGALTLGEQPLGTDRAGYIGRLLRGRHVEGRPALLTRVDEHEDAIRIHTESHRNVLHHFAAHPYVLVRGGAGTGKTVLALDAATRFAAQGDRVLLACWNIVLASYLREALRTSLETIGSPLASQVTADPTGRIVVSHLVGLARQGVDGAPDELDSDWYHETLPEALTPALTEDEFDVVVLDEAQDCTEMWVLAVASLVAREGRWYAFADRQQDLFHADPALPDFLEVEHELKENFRNSRAIARFAAQFGDIEMDCVTGDGPPVAYESVASSQVVDAAEGVARSLRKRERIADEDLAVLWLFHNPAKGASDELARRALDGELVLTNSASFKGMERPVVVLGLDIDPTKTDRRDEVARAIYAAATRARSHLTIVGAPDVAEAYGFGALAEGLRGGRSLRQAAEDQGVFITD